jgi:hypothetical protein
MFIKTAFTKKGYLTFETASLDNDSIYINYKIASAPTLTCAA